MAKKVLTEVRRERYGRDRRAINRHSDRRYRDGGGSLYLLSRTLDGCPPFFEAYGPFAADRQGHLPRLPVGGREYWGDGWSWKRALAAFLGELGAELAEPATEGGEAHGDGV